MRLTASDILCSFVDYENRDLEVVFLYWAERSDETWGPGCSNSEVYYQVDGNHLADRPTTLIDDDRATECLSV